MGAAGRSMNTEIFVGEKARADRAVRDSEARFKRLLASVTDYVYTVSIDHGRVVSTEHGPGCEAVTGYSPEEFNADDQLWYRMIFEPDRAAVLNQARLILKGVAPPPIEHRIIHKNGEIRWIRNTPVPRLRADGQLGGYDGLVSDISERKRAEHLLAVQYSATRILAHASTLDDALPQALEAICAIFGSFLWDFAAFWRVKGSPPG